MMSWVKISFNVRNYKMSIFFDFKSLLGKFILLPFKVLSM